MKSCQNNTQRSTVRALRRWGAMGALTSAVATTLVGVGMYSAQRQDALYRFAVKARQRLLPQTLDAAKPFRVNEFGQLVAYPGKIEVARPPVGPRTVVAFTFGQSNSASYGGEQFEAATDRVTAFWGGRFYRAADPLLGASGLSGGPWIVMANELVSHGQADNVILIAAGIGSTSVREWRQGGRLHGMLQQRLREVRDSGMEVTHFLWHQGESDNPAVGGDLREYADGMAEVIAAARAEFPASRFFVARASVCLGVSPSAPLREVQSELTRQPGVYLGPDTDAIGERHDGCHLTGRGLVRHAQGWVEALAHPRQSLAEAL